MKKSLPLAFLAILFFVTHSCKKNEAINQDAIVPFKTGKTITTVVAGKVTDQTGAALNNVQISIGTTITTTDVNGSFIIPKATHGEKVGFIKATKDGYFAGSRTIIPKEKVINNIVIQLVKKTTSGSFTNASGGTVTVATGGSIVFPSNAIALKNGGAYTGSVNVSAYFLDPTSNNCYKEMPGDLRGVNTSNNEQVLTSYGMMAVELQGSNGEALQMASGKTATISFPIVPATQSKAPATIPLWFFDETKGMWVEQGTATKTGNNYVGTVSHFTWWNCDYGGGPITLTATFVDQNGSPLSNYHVYFITNAGWNGGGGSGCTASNGSVTGNIPANTPIIVKVESNAYCGNSFAVLYTATLGSFTQNTNLGNITVNLVTQAPTTVNIKGTVVDCSNNLVSYGYAVIHFDNKVYYEYITNGVFALTNIYCTTVPNGIANIDVVDLTTLKQNTTATTVNITGAGTFNAGQIAVACGVKLFVTYTAKFVDANGGSLNDNFYVSILGDSLQYFYPQNGVITALIPVNKILTRKTEIITGTSFNCGGVDSAQIRPFSTDFNAGTINIAVKQQLSLLLSGIVKDCNNNNVTGIASMWFDDVPHSMDIKNGIFSETIYRCNSNPITTYIHIDDYNYQNYLKHQNRTTIPVSISNSDVNLGTIQLCDVSFYYFTFKNSLYLLDSSNAFANLSNTSTTIDGVLNYPIYPSRLMLSFARTSVGTGAVSAVTLTLGGKTYSNFTSTPTINITEYGNIGQYIAGDFNAMNIMDTINGVPTLSPLSGSFRIKRTQ